MRSSLIIALATTSMALSSCSKSPNGTQQDAFAPASQPTADQPSDELVTQAIQTAHTANCDQLSLIKQITAGRMPIEGHEPANNVAFAMQVRDALTKSLENNPQATLIDRRTVGRANRTNVEMQYEEKFTAAEPVLNGVAPAPFTLRWYADPNGEGADSVGIAVSGCLYVPDTVAVIDREEHPMSKKMMIVRYQETFRMSSVPELLSHTDFTGALAQNLSTTYPLPNGREGQSVWRKIDATGWRLESDSNIRQRY